MCNACHNVSCGSDMFGAGRDDEEFDTEDDDYGPSELECVTPQADRMPSPELQAVLRDALAKFKPK